MKKYIYFLKSVPVLFFQILAQGFDHFPSSRHYCNQPPSCHPHSYPHYDGCSSYYSCTPPAHSYCSTASARWKPVFVYGCCCCSRSVRWCHLLTSAVLAVVVVVRPRQLFQSRGRESGNLHFVPKIDFFYNIWKIIFKNTCFLV